MQFLQPAYLYLALLVVVPLLLYFFRRKSRAVRVSSLLFFKSLARGHQDSPWLRRLKKLLSLLIGLLILAAVVLALAGLTVSPRADDMRQLVIALDRSASMAATDSADGKLLQRAVQDVEQRLTAVPVSVPVVLVAFDARAEVVLAATTNRRELLRALRQLVVRPLEADFSAGLALSRQMAGLNEPSQTWVVTDQPPMPVPGPAGDDEPAPRSLVWLQHALPQPVNAGITAFQIRASPLQRGKFQAFVQVRLNRAAISEQEIELEIRLGGVPVQLRRLTLAPGGSEPLVLDLDGVDGQLVEAEISMAADALATDNWAGAIVPELRPLSVAWLRGDDGGDPFTGLALQALTGEGRVQVLAGGGDSWPLQQQVDVVVFDGWLPPTWEHDEASIVINPPSNVDKLSLVALSGSLARDRIRVANADHPLLFRVPGTRVSLAQTASVDARGSLESLWMAGDDTVLAAGEIGGQRLVLMGFSPQRSGFLPLSAAYPLLLGNAVFWCAAGSDGGSNEALPVTGKVIDLGPQPGDVTWQSWQGGGLMTEVVPSPGGLLELDRVGLWSAGDGARGNAFLGSVAETDVPALAVAADKPEGAWERLAWRLRGDLVPWLIALALVLLVLESWLFHRHAVH